MGLALKCLRALKLCSFLYEQHPLIILPLLPVLLQLVAPRMSSSELMSVGPSELLPGLFAAFHHPRPDVRKAVVFCLVDMWHAAGEG